MKRLTPLLSACILATLAASVRAVDPMITISGLTAGKYAATITPNINRDQASKIRKQLSQIHGLRSVDVNTNSSSAHFTVKDGAQVYSYEVVDAVRTATSNSAVSELNLEAVSPSNVHD